MELAEQLVGWQMGNKVLPSPLQHIVCCNLALCWASKNTIFSNLSLDCFWKHFICLLVKLNFYSLLMLNLGFWGGGGSSQPGSQEPLAYFRVTTRGPQFPPAWAGFHPPSLLASVAPMPLPQICQSGSWLAVCSEPPSIGPSSARGSQVCTCLGLGCVWK